MFRLSKLTDYGIVVLAHLAREAGEGEAAGRASAEPRQSHNARELATGCALPLPVVSKVLKALTRAGILESSRGIKGGYALAVRPEELTVAEMISALDGPLALTQCNAGPALCDLESSCAIRNPWQIINQVVDNALSSVTLADLVNPDFLAQQSPLSSLGIPANVLGGIGPPGGE